MPSRLLLLSGPTGAVYTPHSAGHSTRAQHSFRATDQTGARTCAPRRLMAKVIDQCEHRQARCPQFRRALQLGQIDDGRTFHHRSP